MPSSPLSASPESPETLSSHSSEPDLHHGTDSLSDDYPVEPPSSAANIRPAKKIKPKPSKARNRVIKKQKERDEIKGASCHLLHLPGDVLHLLLVRLPPRSLLQMSATCKLLNTEIKNESCWRQCYINHFLWEGASSNPLAREEVKVLVQGCMGTGGRGWKREALSRTGMLERWVNSRTSSVVHIPVNVLVNSLSLSYPPQLGPAKITPLVVGKMTGGGQSPASDSPVKMSHRQKYEMMLAVSSRPPPTLYSAGLDNSALVKSDPLTGKVSKGFWGPGQDANFHLRPHWDPSSAPAAVFIPKRSQTHMLWGQLTGYLVHTTMQTRSHATHGGRANSVNVYSKPSDIHTGAVTSIHQPETETLKWVSGGEDGCVKYWQLHPGSGKSGKKTPTEQPASISCLFTSEIVEPFKNRSEEIRLRQMAQPDPITSVVCDPLYDIVAGATEDGDLRVWFDAATEPRQVRIDVGSREDFGSVKHLFMLCSERAEGLAAAVIVHHEKHPALMRYDILGDTVKTSSYTTPGGAPITAVFASLDVSLPIAAPPQVEATLSARIVTPASGSASGANTPPELPIEDLPRRLAETEYGRFLIAGDESGQAYVWPWDNRGKERTPPMRNWAASEGKVTAIDYSCGLVSIGSYDGHYGVFDPLPVFVEKLRAFRPPSHYTPGDLQLAASDQPRAKYYNVNQLLVDNDLVIAAIGRNVQTWRAGTGKGRQSGKNDGASRKANANSGGKGDFRGSRALDLRDLHHDAVESHYEIQAENEVERASVSHEQQHRAAMEDLGLADGDAALQYALMVSQQEAESPVSPDPTSAPYGNASDDEAEAIRAVEEFKRVEEQQRAEQERADADDLAEILEMIRLAEDGERK